MRPWTLRRYEPGEPGAPVTVRTDRRRLRADQVVVAAGPWTRDLLAAAGLPLPLAPAVAQVTFLDAPALVDRPGIAEWPSDGGIGAYGHPVPGIGYKIAFDAGAAGWDPDVTAWDPDPAEAERLLDWLARRMPSVEPRVDRVQRHPWTMTPDADFIVDRWGSIVVAGGCSGHAFKFGPALGPPRGGHRRGRPRPGRDPTRPTRPTRCGPVGNGADQPLTGNAVPRIGRDRSPLAGDR